MAKFPTEKVSYGSLLIHDCLFFYGVYTIDTIMCWITPDRNGCFFIK